MSDEIQFQNMDSWKGGGQKFGLTFKQIVLMHINRCVVNGSVEWHGGYWNEKYRQGFTDRVYVPNSRETYCNSVKMLRACLIGYFDDKMKEADNKLKKEFDKRYVEFEEREKEERDKQIKSDYNKFRVEWHISLFEELIMLSKRLNFFEEESADEEL